MILIRDSFPNLRVWLGVWLVIPVVITDILHNKGILHNRGILHNKVILPKVDTHKEDIHHKAILRNKGILHKDILLQVTTVLHTSQGMGAWEPWEACWPEVQQLQLLPMVLISCHTDLITWDMVLPTMEAVILEASLSMASMGNSNMESTASTRAGCSEEGNSRSGSKLAVVSKTSPGLTVC